MKIAQAADNQGVLSERIKAQISQMILNGELAAGDRLKLSELARRFGVSAMPVREAIWRLEASGIIETIPNRGAVVRGIDETLVINVYETRRAIDGMLLEKVVANATNADIRDIAAAEKAFVAAAETRDTALILECDTRFHLTIHTLAGNDFALALQRDTSQLTGLVRLRVGFSEERLEQIIEDHSRMVAAIRNGDVQALVQASNMHSNGARRDLLAQLQADSSVKARQR